MAFALRVAVLLKY